MCQGLCLWTAALRSVSNTSWWKNLAQAFRSIRRKLVSQWKGCRGKVLLGPWKHISARHQAHPSAWNAYVSGLHTDSGWPTQGLLPMPCQTNTGDLTSGCDDKYHSPVTHLHARLGSDKHDVLTAQDFALILFYCSRSEHFCKHSGFYLCCIDIMFGLVHNLQYS